MSKPVREIVKRVSFLRACARLMPSERGPSDSRARLPDGLGQDRVPGMATSAPALSAGAPLPAAFDAVTTQLRLCASSSPASPTTSRAMGDERIEANARHVRALALVEEVDLSGFDAEAARIEELSSRTDYWYTQIFAPLRAELGEIELAGSARLHAAPERAARRAAVNAEATVSPR